MIDCVSVRLIMVFNRSSLCSQAPASSCRGYPIGEQAELSLCPIQLPTRQVTSTPQSSFLELYLAYWAVPLAGRVGLLGDVGGFHCKGRLKGWVGIEILLKQEREGAKSKHRGKSFLYRPHTHIHTHSRGERGPCHHRPQQRQRHTNRCCNSLSRFYSLALACMI